MIKEHNIINYYLITNKLKNVIRTGWKFYKVNRKRLESIAEHVYGVQMLAIAMKSEFEYDVDIMKVIYMLAIHELGETIIGDIMPFEKNKEDKEKIEHEAVHKILSPLIAGEEIEKLFLEFDAHETLESKFAFQCDKLESDIQSKIYEEEGCIEYDKIVGLLISNGKKLDYDKSFSTYFIESHEKYYDENFMKIVDYIKNNDIITNTEQ